MPNSGIRPSYVRAFNRAQDSMVTAVFDELRATAAHENRQERLRQCRVALTAIRKCVREAHNRNKPL